MLIILDRDGVINYDSDDYIKSPAEWEPIPGSLAAIAKLCRAGHSVVVATNQSGLGRGYYNEETLRQIHYKMIQQLADVGGRVEGIFFCPHVPTDNCLCRKPKPGLLLQIADTLQVDLRQALLVGDSLRDIEAAQAVGCPAILVKTGKDEAKLLVNDEASHLSRVPVFEDLADVVDTLFSDLG